MSPSTSRLATLAARAREAVTGLLDPRTDIDEPPSMVMTVEKFGGAQVQGIRLTEIERGPSTYYAAYGHVAPAAFAAAATELDQCHTDGEPFAPANVTHVWAVAHPMPPSPPGEEPNWDCWYSFGAKERPNAFPMTLIEIDD